MVCEQLANVVAGILRCRIVIFGHSQNAHTLGIDLIVRHHLGQELRPRGAQIGGFTGIAGEIEQAPAIIAKRTHAASDLEIPLVERRVADTSITRTSSGA